MTTKNPRAKSETKEVFSKTTPWHQFIHFFKNRPPKAIIVLVSVVVPVVVLFSVLAVIQPDFQNDSVKAAEVQPFASTLTNKKSITIKRTNGCGLWVKVVGKVYTSSGKSITIPHIPEGEQKFVIRGLKDYFLFRLTSRASNELRMEFDYTPPIVTNIQGVAKDNLYYQEATTLTFTTNEFLLQVFSIIDGEQVPLFIPEMNSILHGGCTFPGTTTSDSINWSCPLSLTNGEKQYTVSFVVVDEAGNETRLLDNKVVSYVVPISLTCKNLPEYSNKKSLTLSCIPNKNGSLLQGERQIALTKDKAVSVPITLSQEGENKITLSLKDENGRSFPQNLVIIRDTVAPYIDVVSIPSTLDYGTDLTAKITSNEEVTGTLEFIPTPSKGYKISGYIKYSFKIKAKQVYSQKLDTDRFRATIAGMYYPPNPIRYVIKIKDSAGNTKTLNGSLTLMFNDVPL